MKNKTSDGVVETIKTLVYAVAIAIVIRTFLYEPFNIPSGSMVPTLLVGDYLFVSKFSYGYSRYSLPFGLPLIKGRLFFHEPQRGDVIVFKYPRDPSTDYIKRLIGLPGEKIQVVDATLYINDVPVKRTRTDSYVDPETGLLRQQFIETLPNGVQHPVLLAPRDHQAPGRRCDDPREESRDLENTCPFIVPPDHYFMMGDNRDNSADSRDPSSGVGYVPAENLVGHAEFIFFSTNGYARWWEIWNWPFTVRYDRLFTAIH
ncbi:MAG TPA: signal peptidase I [Stellaceae bacterium]|nr:signal peptidase I [Stellaceae bacterium]